MRAPQIFYLSFAIITGLIVVTAAAALVMNHETTIVLTYQNGSPDPKTVELTKKILTERIKAFGDAYDVRSGKVEYQEPNFIVRLRSPRDVGDFQDVLVRQDEAQLRLVADKPAIEDYENHGVLPTGYEAKTITHETVKLGTWSDTNKTEETTLLAKEPVMTIASVKKVQLHREGFFYQPVLTIEFTEDQAREFAELTRTYKGKRLALCIEDEIFAAPEISAPITDGLVQIQNLVFYKKMQKLESLLSIGALPAPLHVVKASSDDAADDK